MIIKKRREETRGDRDNVIETRPFDGKPPFIDFIGFNKVRPITLDKFLVPRRISSYNLQRLLSFYHRPSATTQCGFNTPYTRI